MDTNKAAETNGVEKKPGITRRVTKITFTVGPLRQEDLSTPEINRLMAMAQRFDIFFNTVPILDSNQTDKLGYLKLPYEIRSQDYLLVLYDRLCALKLSNNRDVSVRFPEELRRHVEECRRKNYAAKKKAQEDEKEKQLLMKRSLYATYVDKDTGKDSLVEKFPDAKEIILRQHNFQWFGCMEFEDADEALKILKQANQIEIEGQKVKIVRIPPDFEEKKQTPQKSPMQHKRPFSEGGRGGGSHGNRGGFNKGGGPKPLLSVGAGRGGYMSNIYGGAMMMAGGMYTDYGGDYAGGYRMQGGQGKYQLGAKRKAPIMDFGGSGPKKLFPGGQRGGRGGRGGRY